MIFTLGFLMSLLRRLLPLSSLLLVSGSQHNVPLQGTGPVNHCSLSHPLVAVLSIVFNPA